MSQSFLTHPPLHSRTKTLPACLMSPLSQPCKDPIYRAPVQKSNIQKSPVPVVAMSQDKRAGFSTRKQQTMPQLFQTDKRYQTTKNPMSPLSHVPKQPGNVQVERSKPVPKISRMSHVPAVPCPKASELYSLQENHKPCHNHPKPGMRYQTNKNFMSPLSHVPNQPGNIQVER